MRHKIIECNGISFGYHKEKQLLKNINLSIEANECVGIVGPNGAGKSTILKLIMGLLNPDSGDIIIDGVVMKKNNVSSVRKKIGYTFQDADHQLFMPTVYEDVAFSARNEKISPEIIDKIVIEALTKVNAMHLAYKAPYKLSGGEKRAVSIATVLAMSPEVMILDEPTVGLDPRSRREIISLFKTIDKTKIIATHDMDLVLELCDRIIIINKGSIFAQDRPEILFKNKKLVFDSGLEMPLSMQGCGICNRGGFTNESIIL